MRTDEAELDAGIPTDNDDIVTTTFAPIDHILNHRIVNDGYNALRSTASGPMTEDEDRATLAGGGAYPDDNPKTVMGLKKPSLRSIPPIALLHLGKAMENGAAKYGRFNWRDRRVTSSVYYDAIQRHMLSWWDGEQTAADSGCHHLAHVMACCAILLDAEAHGNLNDDRRADGLAADVIAAWTKLEP